MTGTFDVFVRIGSEWTQHCKGATWGLCLAALESNVMRNTFDEIKFTRVH